MGKKASKPSWCCSLCWKAHGERTQARYSWGVLLNFGLGTGILTWVSMASFCLRTNCMNRNVSLSLYIFFKKKNLKIRIFYEELPTLSSIQCFPQAEGIIPKNSLRKVLHGSWFLHLLLCIQHWFPVLSHCLCVMWCSTAFARIWLLPVLLNTLILTGSSY